MRLPAIAIAVCLLCAVPLGAQGPCYCHSGGNGRSLSFQQPRYALQAQPVFSFDFQSQGYFRRQGHDYPLPAVREYATPFADVLRSSRDFAFGYQTNGGRVSGVVGRALGGLCAN
jgi:hypothetical protein